MSNERSGCLGGRRLELEGKLASSGRRGLQFAEKGRSKGGRGLQLKDMQTSQRNQRLRFEVRSMMKGRRLLESEGIPKFLDVEQEFEAQCKRSLA